MFTFDSKIDVPNDRVANLFVTAFEAGVSSWLGKVEPRAGNAAGHEWYSNGDNFSNLSWGFTAHFDGGDDDEGSFASAKEVRILDVITALRLLHDTQPRHFNDMAADNSDAETADVFMQLLLLGEIIYG